MNPNQVDPSARGTTVIAADGEARGHLTSGSRDCDLESCGGKRLATMPERPWYRHPFWQGFARAAASRSVAFTYLFGMGVYVGIALARNQAVAAWLMSLGALAYGALYARWQRHMLRDAVNEVMRSAREEARS